jgi:DNA-binding transcriptional ArsR family regulator
MQLLMEGKGRMSALHGDNHTKACRDNTEAWYDGRVDALFGSGHRTDALVAIARLGETYVGELATVLDLHPTQVARAVASLEEAGVVEAVQRGSMRRLRLRPQFPMVGELQWLLLRLSSTPRYAEAWGRQAGTIES